eukprot:TRINITY_DN11400_c1_g2_i1.p2 TRINITY_DN11400_c1_g2~~TRINITY_DN11400_c1_g2_i1.p2  ORF type:complete len:286 (-),score=16.07 TRINITY_DN11400_c1_g2_i1:2011-2868(-)
MSESKAIQCSCRLVILLAIGAGVVALVGIAFTAVESLYMGGLQSDVGQLKSETAQLEYANQVYQKNIYSLEDQLSNLTAINETLYAQVQFFVKRNAKLQQSCSALNNSNSQFEQQVERLQSINGGLSYQVNKFQNETEDLGDAVQHLQALSDHLQDQLSEFQELSDGVKDIAQTTGNDFQQVVTVTKDLLGNETDITFSNQKAIMLTIATNVEFLDGKPGFNQTEYTICLDQFATVLETSASQLLTLFPFKFQVDSLGVVEYTTMLLRISDIMEIQESKWKLSSF